MRWKSLLLLLIAFPACGREEEQERDFLVRVGEERFVVRIADPAQIALAREILAGRRSPMIVTGELRPGDGGFNRDPIAGRRWSWHLDPRSVTFAEVTIELCDGRPSFVEENLSYWLYTVRRFCPWNSILERELP
jgi:hypothetical protein|nr:MAG: hypothetical protein KatS3mg041_1259 [Bacteroidota bacterium]